MTGIALSQASKAQLINQAELLGLEIPARITAEELRTMIVENGGPDTLPAPRVPLMTPDVDEDFGRVIPTSKVSSEEREDDKRAGYSKVSITISQQDGEQPNVFLSCNGDGMLIPRGEKVEIPRKYFEVLENCVRTDYASGIQQGDGALQASRQSPRYSYVVHDRK